MYGAGQAGPLPGLRLLAHRGEGAVGGEPGSLLVDLPPSPHAGFRAGARGPCLPGSCAVHHVLPTTLAHPAGAWPPPAPSALRTGCGSEAGSRSPSRAHRCQRVPWKARNGSADLSEKLDACPQSRKAFRRWPYLTATPRLSPWLAASISPWANKSITCKSLEVVPALSPLVK